MNEVLKTASHIIAPVLTKWFNTLSRTAYFPEEWKTAIIVPIFKDKGSVLDIANYRPIALTSCVRRVPVYQKCILQELVKLNLSQRYKVELRLFPAAYRSFETER
jgi:hypothetical protein